MNPWAHPILPPVLAETVAFPNWPLPILIFTVEYYSQAKLGPHPDTAHTCLIRGQRPSLVHPIPTLVLSSISGCWSLAPSDAPQTQFTAVQRNTAAMPRLNYQPRLWPSHLPEGTTTQQGLAPQSSLFPATDLMNVSGCSDTAWHSPSIFFLGFCFGWLVLPGLTWPGPSPNSHWQLLGPGPAQSVPIPGSFKSVGVTAQPSMNCAPAWVLHLPGS